MLSGSFFRAWVRPAAKSACTLKKVPLSRWDSTVCCHTASSSEVSASTERPRFASTLIELLTGRPSSRGISMGFLM